MRFTHVFAGMALALVGACASTARTRPEATPPAPLTQRVAALLAHRHVSPPASPALLSARLFDRIRAALGCHVPPSQALSAERDGLLATLERGDLSFVERAGAECGAPPGTREQALALVLNALAHAYDPHSRYLGQDALLRFQAQTHTPGEAGATHHELVEHQGRHIGIVSVPSFYLRTGRSVSADLQKACVDLRARGAEVLLLDLRGNGGGVQREAARVFGLFSSAGLVAQLRRRDHEPELLSAPTDLVAWPDALLIRVDAGTASVAELLAAALQDDGRALIIGQRTHGKGTGQTLVPLGSPRDPQEGAVDVTDRRFYRLDGRPLQREGVTPDIALPGPELASERTRPDALPADQLAPVLPRRSFQQPPTAQGAQALAAAIDFAEHSKGI